MKKLIAFLFLITVTFSSAQDLKISTKDNDLKLTSLPYYSFGRGVGITSPDSIFQFNIRFRMQDRLSYYDNEGADSFYEAQVRRLRLRFDGYVGSPKFLYVIQLSFGAGDVGPEKVGENLNVIRDAVVYYRPNNHWQYGFGVTKLPGTRQAVNSSGAIQLTDRSINNTKFNIDRDFGFHFANLNEYENKFSYNFKGAVTLGEGRNWTTNNPNSTLKDNNGLSYTGKIELMPLGKFKKDGHYFEGDLLREQKPKFMISGVYNYNDKARESQGQMGDLLYETSNLSTVLIDFIGKYNGWAFMSTYMMRDASKAITTDVTNPLSNRAVFVGNGFDNQLSYCFASKYEVIGRFSKQMVDNEVKTFYPNTEQLSFGVNKYIWEHALKLQAEFTTEKQEFFDGTNKQNWYVRFQVEIGI